MSLLLAVQGAAAQPDDPFNLTEGLDESLESTGSELSFYQQIDDDVVAGVDPTLIYLLDAQSDPLDDTDLGYYQVIDNDPVVAPDTLQPNFDLDEPIDQEAFELSFYASQDDDPVVVDPSLAYLLDSGLDDDLAVPDSDYTVIADDVVVQPEDLQLLAEFDDSASQDGADLSFYQQIEDDAVGVQPDTLFGNFDLIEDVGLFDDAQSFYYQQDDDVVVPPGIPETGAGGLAIKPYYLSYEADDDDRQERERPVQRKREPFSVKLTKPEDNLKSLSEKLYALGKKLGQNKQTVKDRIKAEQKKQAEDLAAREAKLLVIVQMIELFETELHNENARRLLIILAEDRP